MSSNFITEIIFVITEIIFVLIDCDGDVLCAYDDKDFAIKEGQDCGCDVEEMRFIKIK